jgi:hypothetical protein
MLNRSPCSRWRKGMHVPRKALMEERHLGRRSVQYLYLLAS